MFNSGLNKTLNFTVANFIAAHTHFCLTEMFINFDPTPNALRNTTPFPQQNNQQNRLSHATVLRDTIRFSILIFATAEFRGCSCC